MRMHLVVFPSLVRATYLVHTQVRQCTAESTYASRAVETLYLAAGKSIQSG